MRTRYYVRISRVEKALRPISAECFHKWRDNGRTPQFTDFRDKWLLDNHNIVISQQANGVEKVGFASKGDMIMFLLKWGYFG